MPDRRVSRNRPVDIVLDETGVREVETGVHPKRQDFGVGHYRMAGHVAEIHGSRQLAHHRYMRLGRIIKVEEDQRGPRPPTTPPPRPPPM